MLKLYHKWRLNCWFVVSPVDCEQFSHVQRIHVWSRTVWAQDHYVLGCESSHLLSVIVEIQEHLHKVCLELACWIELVHSVEGQWFFVFLEHQAQSPNQRFRLANTVSYHAKVVAKTYHLGKLLGSDVESFGLVEVPENPVNIDDQNRKLGPGMKILGDQESFRKPMFVYATGHRWHIGFW